MKIKTNRLFRLCIVIILIAAIAPFWYSPAAAISIKDEEELANEFMKLVARHFDLIEDPMIVDYVNNVGRTILAHVPEQPFDFHFYVIRSEVYNAFALPAGHIFINSGLLTAMEQESELAGILAHEISHVVCRHISQRIERSQKINLATMAGMVAGAFLGIATGDATAVQAVTVGSAAAGKSAALTYSREDETQADQLGLDYLNKAGYGGDGLLAVLKKIRSKQWFGSDQIPSYMKTHPAVEDRIADIDTQMTLHERNQGLKKGIDNRRSSLFRKVNVRVTALHHDQEAALRTFATAMEKAPDDPLILYGYALTLGRAGKRDLAIAYLQQALSKEALDPIIISELGRLYFLDGRYEDALDGLEGAVSLPNANPEAYFYLGRTCMELGRFDKAVSAFERLLQIAPEYRAGYQFLGEAYGRLNRMPEAHYHLGMYHYKMADFKVAQYHLARTQKENLDPKKRDAVDKALKSMGKPPNR